MAQYEVAHIEISRYRELQRLVLEGRAKAVIVVDYIDGDALSLVETLEPVDAVAVYKRPKYGLID